MKHHEPQLSNDDDDDESSTSSTPQDNIPAVGAEPFIINEEKLKENLANFIIDIPNFKNQPVTSNFLHPFSSKIIGPRGSGKTSFTISYIQKIACLTFSKIFIVTASHDQPLYDLLKSNDQIYFITLKELDAVVKSHKDILIVLDDVMQETRYNNTLESVFTRGRHQRISIMSLEQDLFYSNPIERRNADYYVLMRMRDTSSLIQFYKRFCSDVQQWRFIDIYEHAVEKPLGYFIVDFVSQKYKYRINSLNLYFDSESIKIECIDKSFNPTARNEANKQLQDRFKCSILALKSGKKHFENETLFRINVDQEIPSQTISPQEKSGQTKASYICDICHIDCYQPDCLAMHKALNHRSNNVKNDDDSDDGEND